MFEKPWRGLDRVMNRGLKTLKRAEKVDNRSWGAWVWCEFRTSSMSFLCVCVGDFWIFMSYLNILWWKKLFGPIWTFHVESFLCIVWSNNNRFCIELLCFFMFLKKIHFTYWKFFYTRYTYTNNFILKLFFVVLIYWFRHMFFWLKILIDSWKFV